MGRDYYKILGIARDATQDQIKKAYRKQALAWHPDKNQHRRQQAEEVFKDIAEAYDVLSDDKKKSIYDQYGEEGLKAGGAPGFNGMPGAGNGADGFRYTFQGDPYDLFSRFMGGRDAGMFGGFGDAGMFGDRSIFEQMGHGGFGGVSGSTGQKREFPVALQLSLEELYQGTTKKMKITRKTNSPGLNRPDSVVLDVPVKPGYKAGTRITYAGEGDELGNSRQFQDIVFVVRDKKHKVFTRDGNNLVLKTSISLKDALCGTIISVPSLDGTDKVHNIRVEDVVFPGYTKIVEGLGMPISKRPGSFGDLILTFSVGFPKTLTADVKRKLSEIL